MKKGSHHTEETRKKMSEAKKGKFVSKKTRKKMSEAKKGKIISEETRKKISEAEKGEKNHNFGKHPSDETRRRISESKMGKIVSEETRKKISESNKGEKSYNFGKHPSDETRKKLSEAKMGEKNPSYVNGNSNKYCSLFNEKFKEKIREKFDRRCFLCGLNEEENSRKLPVHHISYNKNCLCDGADCYFIPLCDACHSKTNFNREFYEIFLTKCCKYSGVMGY